MQPKKYCDALASYSWDGIKLGYIGDKTCYSYLPFHHCRKRRERVMYLQRDVTPAHARWSAVWFGAKYKLDKDERQLSITPFTIVL